MKTHQQIQSERNEKREAMSMMNLPENIHNILLGDIALQRKEGEDEWIEFEANEVNMPLIAEFPQDYKRL